MKPPSAIKFYADFGYPIFHEVCKINRLEFYTIFFLPPILHVVLRT